MQPRSEGHPTEAGPRPGLLSGSRGGGGEREIPWLTLQSPTSASHWLNLTGNQLSLVSGKSSLQEPVPLPPLPNQDTVGINLRMELAWEGRGEMGLETSAGQASQSNRGPSKDFQRER